MARTLGSYAKLTKPKISEIALHLFAEQGYAAVSMRQIAFKVGLQVGALYNYFPDKQTILSELLINHMENLLQTGIGKHYLKNPISYWNFLWIFTLSITLTAQKKFSLHIWNFEI